MRASVTNTRQLYPAGLISMRVMVLEEGETCPGALKLASALTPLAG